MVGIVVSSRFGQPIGGGNGRMVGDAWRPKPASSGTVTAILDQLPVHSDNYRISVTLGDAFMEYDQKADAVEFDFLSPNFYPQMPPVQVIGPLDLAWRWSLQAD